MIDHGAVLLACRAHARTLAVCTTGAFTRASSATYHDVNGIVQTAAVDVYRGAHYVGGVLTPLQEVAGTNLAAYSQQVDQWSDAGLGTDVTANATNAPDGTATADLIAWDAIAGTSGQKMVLGVEFTGTGTKCVSAYVKVGNGDPNSIGLVDGGLATLHRVRISWAAGVPSLTRITGAGTLHPVVVLANGWYRIAFNCDSVTADANNRFVAIWPSHDDTADTLYAWGVQVEESSAATSYIPTTTAAATRAADTGGESIEATATGYVRTSGSFLTDGFRAGMEVTPTGFSDTTARTITAVTALTMTVNGTPTAQAAVGGRSLAVGLPSRVAFTNVQFSTPDARTPWVEEAYLPGAADRITMGSLGRLEMSGLYQLTVYCPTGLDASALYGYADALVTHFAPDTPLTLSTGDVTRVRGRPAPYPSSVVQVDGGWAACTVTIPLLTRTTNSR